MIGAAVLFRTLEALGVERVYGVAGTQNVEWFEALRTSQPPASPLQSGPDSPPLPPPYAQDGPFPVLPPSHLEGRLPLREGSMHDQVNERSEKKLRKRRRARGEGTIFRRTDGRYAAVVSVGYRNGKRLRKTFYGKTQAEVLGQLTKARRDQQVGLPVAPDNRPRGSFWPIGSTGQRSPGWCSPQQSVRRWMSETFGGRSRKF